MNHSISLVVLTFLVATSATAQSPRTGWWVRLGTGASASSALCDVNAASLICGTHGSSALGRVDLAVGRALSPQLAVGLEVSPDRHHRALNPGNASTLSSLAASVVATVFPLSRVPGYLHVGLGASGLRLRELNNGHTFIQRRVGWTASAALGAEFPISRVVAVGPFLRLDLSEFGASDVFFQRLEQRAVSVGVALTLR